MSYMGRILVALGIAAAVAAPAMAEEGCQAMLQKLDAAMQTAQLADDAKKAVDEMKAKAEEALKAGDEAGCTKAATEALKAAGAMPAEEGK